MVEQRTENPCVPGSIPGGTTYKESFFGVTLFLLLLSGKIKNAVANGLKAQQSHSPGQRPTLYTHLLFFEIIGILYICQMKSSPFTSLTFNDKRISARANLTLSKMIATGNSVINRIFSNFADKIATYRMFNNPKVTMESIVSAYADACKARMAESHCTHVLCLQDTCEINYNGAKKGEHVSMPSVEVQVKGIVEPVLSVSSPINGDK